MNNCTQTKTHILVPACFLLFTFVLSDIQPFDFISIYVDMMILWMVSEHAF